MGPAVEPGCPKTPQKRAIATLSYTWGLERGSSAEAMGWGAVVGLGVSWGCREQAATLPARCSFKSSHFLAGAESFWLLAQHLH